MAQSWFGSHGSPLFLPLQGRRACLATAVDQVLQACPRDMEEEKTMLLVTMLLARKVASHTPSLLRTVFHTTVNFINQNLPTYVRDLVRNVSSLALACMLLVSTCSPNPPPLRSGDWQSPLPPPSLHPESDAQAARKAVRAILLRWTGSALLS